MILKIDAHVHTEKSFDSEQSLADVVEACKSAGIDAVCICDHNIPYTGEREIDGIIIVPGIEISTEYGHLLGLFIDSELKPSRSFDMSVARIKDAGGIAVAAHPYENGKVAKKDLDARLNGIIYELDGIEAVNSRASRFVRKANEYALEEARRFGKLLFAGSDAHVPKEIGSSYVQIDAENRSLEAIRKALTEGKVKLYTKGTVRRINIIKSQYIKLKKSPHSIKRCAGFLLSAAKNIFFEVIRPEKRKLREAVKGEDNCPQ